MKLYTPTLDDDTRHRYVVDVWDADEDRYMPILVTIYGTEARKGAGCALAFLCKVGQLNYFDCNNLIEECKRKKAEAEIQEKRKTSTIIAALRYWQQRDSTQTEAENDIANDGDTIDPLNIAEIDALIEAINFS